MLTATDTVFALPTAVAELRKMTLPKSPNRFIWLTNPVQGVWAEPESDFIKELQKEFRILSNPKQHTFPAPAPKETIDYVAAFKQNDKGFAVVSSEVVNEPVASDHRPIVVELRTAEKADKIFRTKPYLQNPV